MRGQSKPHIAPFAFFVRHARNRWRHTEHLFDQQIYRVMDAFGEVHPRDAAGARLGKPTGSRRADSRLRKTASLLA
jgi:hypothetical protein